MKATTATAAGRSSASSGPIGLADAFASLKQPIANGMGDIRTAIGLWASKRLKLASGDLEAL